MLHTCDLRFKDKAAGLTEVPQQAAHAAGVFAHCPTWRSSASCCHSFAASPALISFTHPALPADVKLVALKVNGEVAPEDAYEVNSSGLTLKSPPAGDEQQLQQIHTCLFSVLLFLKAATPCPMAAAPQPRCCAADRDTAAAQQTSVSCAEARPCMYRPQPMLLSSLETSCFSLP